VGLPVPPPELLIVESPLPNPPADPNGLLPMALKVAKALPLLTLLAAPVPVPVPTAERVPLLRPAPPVNVGYKPNEPPKPLWVLIPTLPLTVPGPVGREFTVVPDPPAVEPPDVDPCGEEEEPLLKLLPLTVPDPLLEPFAVVTSPLPVVVPVKEELPETVPPRMRVPRREGWAFVISSSGAEAD
jgi:hypothetical protein